MRLPPGVAWPVFVLSLRPLGPSMSCASTISHAACQVIAGRAGAAMPQAVVAPLHPYLYSTAPPIQPALVPSLPASCTCPPPLAAGHWMLFFVLQGPLLSAEAWLRALGRQTGICVPPALRTAATLALLHDRES